MNIFAISDSPILAAQWQHDRHVTKMTVESAQLLSAVCHTQPEFMARVAPHHVPLLYKVSHVNNPLTLWAGASDRNFVWLVAHAVALVSEKHRRFPLNGMHKTYPLIVAFANMAAQIVRVERFWTRDADRNIVIDPKILEFASHHSPFYQAMPDEYKCFDSVEAYRRLYLDQKIFQDHVKWTACATLPSFIDSFIEHGAFQWTPMAAGRIAHRIIDLQNAHNDGLIAARMPRNPHPDLLKPANPKAIKRFGVRS